MRRVLRRAASFVNYPRGSAGHLRGRIADIARLRAGWWRLDGYSRAAAFAGAEKVAGNGRGASGVGAGIFPVQHRTLQSAARASSLALARDP